VSGSRLPIGGSGLLLATALTLFVLLGGGCGSERKLTATEFIDEMNANGASLELGPVITQNPDGTDVVEVKFTRTAPTATGEGAKPAASGSATLLALDDSAAAEDEYARCQGAPALTCFRAANIVLRVEELEPTDQALLTTAIEGLADGGG
jgi:hypothetical protein